jgi:hypothetical protein
MGVCMLNLGFSIGLVVPRDRRSSPNFGIFMQIDYFVASWGAIPSYVVWQQLRFASDPLRNRNRNLIDFT